MNAKIRAGAHKTVGIGWREAVLGDEPIHEMHRGSLNGHRQRAKCVSRDDGVRLFDAQPRYALALDEIKLHPDRRLGFGRGAGEFGVALTGMDVAEVEECTGMKNRQEDAVAR